jgi:hypothetical protein
MQLVGRKGIKLIFDEFTLDLYPAGMAHQHAWLKFTLTGRTSNVKAYFITHDFNITLILLIYN